MEVLVDTNVLLRSLYPQHPQCAAAPTKNRKNGFVCFNVFDIMSDQKQIPA